MAQHVSDSILLERYVRGREEAAFVDLVKRHGPRVEGTCRAVLRNEHDIEDVFQATFLVLARKAAGIPWRESVGSWLCAVAYRLAMNARAGTSRHRRRETPFATFAGPVGSGERDGRLPDRYHPVVDPFVEIERNDLRELLNDELLQLPEKYRAPVVLCDLEGRTHEQAAAQLGWPSGSVSRRLGRARALLRQRLVHRGVILATGLLGIGVAAVLAYRGARHDDRPAAAVRPLMISLKPVSQNESGLSSAVARFAEQHSAADLAQIMTQAQKTAGLATELESYGPVKDRIRWQSYAREMRFSSAELARAAQQNNQLAMLSAARRLDASCVKCHEVFHQ